MKHDLKIPGHPANSTVKPSRPPDFQIFEYDKWWFKEMIYVKALSDLTDDYPALLAVCPVSGRLMYMSRYVPIVWNLFDPKHTGNDKLYEAWNAYINKTVEQEVLGGT